MFVFLFSESMAPFFHIIASFPTLIFTSLLVFVVLYWLIAMLGLVDIDVLDLPEADMDAGVDGNSVMAGLLLKFGLEGVPVTLIISIITILGWFISFLLTYFAMPLMGNTMMALLIGSGIFIAAFYGSVMATAYAIRPLRPLFKNATADVQKDIIGQVAIVRTSRVDEEFGEADFNDGGAGLILKIRAAAEDKLTRGDKVILMEYVKENGFFRVISEKEFTQ
ncbi:DUF1449 domain-containing protein [Marinibactrum halimedae]|uniref:DUF1449 family protein n=1 Tax=Marinibactrum halimedae TaxID=1444977 RepID=A0AA37T5U0_9GAMM|nr:DUF1449 domain-containing protein [Marinibactrum halimedae]MCD9460530.1 DUF1449 domain-containing protein [Marinibactrum halimedae]GLS27893.1 hypothetical protein GCM10007877_36120 [Marinibactrum halimedae]